MSEYIPSVEEVACFEGSEDLSDSELLFALQQESEYYADYTIERMQADKSAGLIEWANGYWTGCVPHRIWFAAMRYNDDDWDNGSYDLGEAIKMALKYRAEGDLDAFVSVVEIDFNDVGFCLDEIREF